MKTQFLIILSFFLFSSCAFFEQLSLRQGKRTLIASKEKYELSDKAGKFQFFRESGFHQKDKSFVLKTQIRGAGGGSAKVLERSVTISGVGKLKSKVPVLRPKIAQYTVWFDKKKYFSQLKTNVIKRTLEITMRSPEKKWNGVKEVVFPDNSSVFCFYNQLIECAGMTGFLHRAIREKIGTMNFILIWDGYPYFQEQYANIPNEVFSAAALSYEGEDKKGGQRFTLEVAGQQIFYTIDKDGRYQKQFWVAQGLSIAKPGELSE